MKTSTKKSRERRIHVKNEWTRKLIISYHTTKIGGWGKMSVNRKVGNLMMAEVDVWEPCNALQNKFRK